ncbi:hypothetical protein UACE39S_01009 [Ureibacillus acetophenoni]
MITGSAIIYSENIKRKKILEQVIFIIFILLVNLYFYDMNIKYF